MLIRRFPLLCLIPLLLLACRPELEPREVGQGIKESAKETDALSGRWYVLHQGRFQEAEGPQRRPDGQPSFWTVQERIADLAILGDRIYLAVNGWGLATLNLSIPELPQFEYFYDPLIFQYRTVTALLPEPESLLCHLYFNKTLNLIEEGDLALQGISLLRFLPQEEDYRLIIPPFQLKHPHWECVGFLPEREDRFLLAWKFSGRRETHFHYSRLSLADMTEQPIKRLEFQEAHQPMAVTADLPRPLGQLFQTIMEQSLGESTPASKNPGSTDGGLADLWPTGQQAAIHFLVRSADDPLPLRYAYQPAEIAEAAEFRLLTLRIYGQGEHYYLLSPKGILLRAGTEGEIKGWRLPPLPEDYEYLDLLIAGSHLILSWEEIAFTEVGAAGILLVKLPS